MPEATAKFNLEAFSEALTLRNPDGQPYVLIGGQAVNFWAERYLKTESALRDYAPFTSGDIDYFGSKADVEFIAGQLKRKPIYPYWRAMTALAGTIPLRVAANGSMIEVVRSIFGVKAKTIERSAFPASFIGYQLRVIFPVHLLIGKRIWSERWTNKGGKICFTCA